MPRLIGHAGDSKRSSISPVAFKGDILIPGDPSRPRTFSGGCSRELGLDTPLHPPTRLCLAGAVAALHAPPPRRTPRPSGLRGIQAGAGGVPLVPAQLRRRAPRRPLPARAPLNAESSPRREGSGQKLVGSQPASQLPWFSLGPYLYLPLSLPTSIYPYHHQHPPELGPTLVRKAPPPVVQAPPPRQQATVHPRSRPRGPFTIMFLVTAVLDTTVLH